MPLSIELKNNALRQGELQQQLASNLQRRTNQQSLLERVEQSQQNYDDWDYLNQLIGSSDGEKFRRYAQGLTLEHFVYLANHQLKRLHGRYLLRRKINDAL